eukprot:GEMP01017708.1.p1 GENE.GEMP01017708.1~~GEMP01017708.1.p1  ORF type:complete len:537 (+),score=109.73 GEMP01017708.1:132-1613(+)
MQAVGVRDTFFITRLAGDAGEEWLRSMDNEHIAVIARKERNINMVGRIPRRFVTEIPRRVVAERPQRVVVERPRRVIDERPQGVFDEKPQSAIDERPPEQAGSQQPLAPRKDDGRCSNEVLRVAKVAPAGRRLRPMACLRPIGPEIMQRIRQHPDFQKMRLREKAQLRESVTFCRKARFSAVKDICNFTNKQSYMQISSKERLLLYQWLCQAFPDHRFKASELIVTIGMREGARAKCAVSRRPPSRPRTANVADAAIEDGPWSPERIFPYFEVLILGEESLLSNCCQSPFLMNFDVSDGVMLSCCAPSCPEPVLHMALNPIGLRERLWAKWSRCYGGTLPPVRTINDIMRRQPCVDPVKSSQAAPKSTVHEKNCTDDVALARQDVIMAFFDPRPTTSSTAAGTVAAANRVGPPEIPGRSVCFTGAPGWHCTFGEPSLPCKSLETGKSDEGHLAEQSTEHKREACSHQTQSKIDCAKPRFCGIHKYEITLQSLA